MIIFKLLMRQIFILLYNVFYLLYNLIWNAYEVINHIIIYKQNTTFVS